jgi:hypothetical protein
MAFETVPIAPAKVEEEDPFCRNWYSTYLGMKVPKPMKAKT